MSLFYWVSHKVMSAIELQIEVCIHSSIEEGTVPLTIPLAAFTPQHRNKSVGYFPDRSKRPHRHDNAEVQPSTLARYAQPFTPAYPLA